MQDMNYFLFNPNDSDLFFLFLPFFYGHTAAPNNQLIMRETTFSNT